MTKNSTASQKESDIPPHYIVVMGVSGTGKTTVAQALSERLNWPFQEGDALHPKANVEKMRAGHPLTDTDRAPWLKLCRDWLAKEVKDGHGAILTCSALKRSYREILDHGIPVQFVYLKVDPKVIADRLSSRVGHYMPPSLLPSQLATLEEPTDDEPVIRVPGDAPPEVLVERVIERLRVVPPPTEY
nr:gluconokinase [Saccharibacter sp. 17.LH.SD]